MNVDNIMNDDYYYIIKNDSQGEDVAYYSLLIGINEYFKAYHRVYLSLSKYDRNKRDIINLKIKESESYIESYLNVAIHIQHFFELEIKKILEKKHVLFSVDYKGDPIILNKLINNIPLSKEDTAKMKSVEFSEALTRLNKLVQNGTITDSIGKMLTDNYKLLTALNQLRNTTIHRGRRILKYCELDELFSQNIFPLIKKLFEQSKYSKYLWHYKDKGIYEHILNIITEGNSTTLDYAKIAFEKEMARCKLILKNKVELDEYEDKEYIKKIVEKRNEQYTEQVFNKEVYLKDKICPCCKNKTMFRGSEMVGYITEEIGDEMSGGGVQMIQVPEYVDYFECVWCSFIFTDFMDVQL